MGVCGDTSPSVYNRVNVWLLKQLMINIDDLPGRI